MTMAAARRQAIEHAAMAVAGGRDLAARAGDERTLQAWVRLEAAAKASGEGIGRLLERVGARPGRRETGARAIPDTPVAAVADLALADGFHGAIASFDRGLLQAPALGVRMLPCDLPALRATLGVCAP